MAELVVETSFYKPRHVVRYQETAPFRCALPYLGGAITIDDLSASFIHTNIEFPIVRFYDGAVRPMLVSETHEWSEIEPDRALAASVHQHSGTVMCGCITQDVVVTCDNIGFIHRWRLDGGDNAQ
jgi:hypothetical protein